MFTITATKTNVNGTPKVVAKGHGKQRTLPWDLSKSADFNYGAAVGTLLKNLVDERQKSMLLHPSAKARVKVESLSEAGGKVRFAINV